MYKRALALKDLLAHRSLFLFGPRQTGKSTLLRTTFPEASYWDLLEADTFRELSARPESLRQSLTQAQTLVIIDEIQKLPALLDEVQVMMERNRRLRFVLTASSARKLKRGGANLLGGRALVCRLHPLVSAELASPRLLERMNRGSLPHILDSPIYDEDLRAYVGTYLQEEIRAEGLTRSIDGFSRFLETAGLASGEQINFTEAASDAGLPASTVREFYQILRDTLVGHLLPAYRKTVQRKPVATAKFYLFDAGVARVLKRTGEILEGSDAFGRALEHLVFLELRSYLDYRRSDEPLQFWRSRSKLEVDFVLGDRVAIEVEGTARVSPRDYRGLVALGEERNFARRMVVCRERRRRRTDDGIEIVPVERFLEELWQGGVAE
jgi:predicted AAA+ superfamily ATPase